MNEEDDNADHEIDVLVNNAGISGPGGSVMQLDSDPVMRAFEVLFNGVLYGTKHASTVMIKKGSGNIVNIASITGLVTFINSSHVYSALKSAVIQLTKTSALELGPLGLRVNCICPGFIATPIFGRALNIPEDKLEKSVEIVEELFSTGRRQPEPVVAMLKRDRLFRLAGCYERWAQSTRAN
jgi:NAD(P)-dependent dehydrogenase (short-subunit alcohol dehydrogenase family)